MKPPDGVMLMFDVTELPCFIVPLDVARPMLKSAGMAAVTVTVTADEVLAAKVELPAYAAVIAWEPTLDAEVV